ncbi:MAG: phosphoribosylanthranilate isomerase [Prevotella sp.]|nr:phosphoribosylanthranilate isomerase [Prevotella sp.]
MIVKVCGMRVADNIREVSALGIDWLGLVFWPESPRCVNQLRARGGFYPDYSPLATKISEVGGLPALAAKENNPKRVGVFVDDMPQNIVTRVYNFYLDMVQLHGEESPVMIENLKRTLDPDIRPVKVIKAIAMETEADFDKCQQYEGLVDYFLFHNKCKEMGGSGKQFDWGLLQAYKGKTPFLISGGIGIEDVERIKAIQHPLFVGVDINSKFETEPGVKDVEAVKTFLEKLKN